MDDEPRAVSPSPVRAYLMYDLTDVCGREAHVRAVKSTDLALALWDMDHWLRNKVKHGEDNPMTDAYEAARDALHEILDERAINLDDMLS